MSRILVINDDEAIRVTIGKILELDSHGVVLVANAKRAIHTLQHQNFDWVICDTSEKGDMDVVSQLQQLGASMPIVSIIENFGSGIAPKMAPSQLASMAKKSGALHTLARPFTGNELLALVRKLLHSDGDGL